MKIVFLDIETSGLDPEKHTVIQFAGVAVEYPGLYEIDALEVKLQFDASAASPEALEVNSYDPEAWARDAISPAEGARKIAEWMKQHADVIKISKRTGAPCSFAAVAGHNVSGFDGQFLMALFRRMGVFLPAAIYEAFDTLHLARWATLIRGIGPQDHRLETLHAYYCGEPICDAHDALEDVRAAVRVAGALIDVLEGSPR